MGPDLFPEVNTKEFQYQSRSISPGFPFMQIPLPYMESAEQLWLGVQEMAGFDSVS